MKRAALHIGQADRRGEGPVQPGSQEGRHRAQVLRHVAQGRAQCRRQGAHGRTPCSRPGAQAVQAQAHAGPLHDVLQERAPEDRRQVPHPHLRRGRAVQVERIETQRLKLNHGSQRFKL